MPAFLFTIGALLSVIGLFLIGFFIPNRDFSIGTTFITTGAMAIVGGLVLIGIGAVVRELRKMMKLLDKPALPTRAAAPVAAPSRPAPAPVRPMARPAVVNNARNQRAEPRFEAPESDLPPAAEPPSPSAPTIADVTADRPRAGLFASIRGRSVPPPRAETVPPLPTPPPRKEHSDIIEPPPFEREHEPVAEAGPGTRSSSLSALAARTAARLDLPRPVPDLPRLAPERAPSAPPPPPERPERASEKPPRNLFDTVWPTGSKSPAERNSAEEAAATTAAEPRPTEILKSGVIDGMAYTLYTDGSIEAQLPQGTLRFESIDDLRAHLERNN
ncbi:MAG: hypothetical protein ACXWJ0_04245 [Xanthobacteraceae bacterium]